MKTMINSMVVILCSFMMFAACEKILPPAPNNDEILDGPVDGISEAQLIQHLRGDIAFNDQVFTSETGLGPLFVATSCGSCHAGDGKGHPFTTLTRFGQSDETGNQFLHLGGPQLQNRALPGYVPEQIPTGATFSNFTPPATTGLGYLELVLDEDILAMADPDDSDGDGISGEAHWKNIPSYLTPSANAVTNEGKYLCRFGKKAGAYDLLHQTSNAYNQDMGITSVFEPFDTYSGLVIDPEVLSQTVHDVVLYLQTLKAPIQRNQNDDEVNEGNKVFKEIGCENCHRQTLKTGFSPIHALSHVEFHPYTDLLLHDMGSDLDDGYTEGNAKTYEWRTPALWGLGLSPNSQGGQYYLLHDGRAHSIEEAILLHGGEANNSKNQFQNLSPEDIQVLITFLESL
jgi:CxxC motif-containing protein (DUF1111 family)